MNTDRRGQGSPTSDVLELLVDFEERALSKRLFCLGLGLETPQFLEAEDPVDGDEICAGRPSKTQQVFVGGQIPVTEVVFDLADDLCCGWVRATILCKIVDRNAFGMRERLHRRVGVLERRLLVRERGHLVITGLRVDVAVICDWELVGGVLHIEFC